MATLVAPVMAPLMGPVMAPLIAPLVPPLMAPVMAPLMEPQKSKVVAENHNNIMLLVPIVNLLAGKKYWREKKKTQLTTSTYEFWREKTLGGRKKNTTHNLYVVLLAGVLIFFP